jgi:hypothetical protein
LHSYEDVPEKNFWLRFPSRKLPSKIDSSIDTVVFKQEIDLVSDRLTEAELSRATKCLSYLNSGAPAFQRSNLGPCSVKNSKDASNTARKSLTL